MISTDYGIKPLGNKIKDFVNPDVFPRKIRFLNNSKQDLIKCKAIYNAASAHLARPKARAQLKAFLQYEHIEIRAFIDRGCVERFTREYEREALIF